MELLVVTDEFGNIYGIYEELLDADDRVEELGEEGVEAFIEEYTLNKDNDPE